MNDPVRTSKMDKTVVTICSLGDEPDDVAYWRGKTPEERLAAMEFMRIINYGYDATSARLQRVLTVTPLRGS